MGNHLVDITSPEFGTGGSADFTRRLIFGSYEGHITFVEPVTTLAYLKSRQSECMAIKQPQAFEVSGYHPTTYCIRHRAGRNDITVSLEDFFYREAGY
jgi:hypothetical protein